MKSTSRGWGRLILVMAPFVVIMALVIITSGAMSATVAGCAYAGNCGGGPSSNTFNTPFPAERYGLQNDLLYVANGRASNVAVIDVASMNIVDYIAVPRAPLNVAAIGGQAQATIDKTLAGLGLKLPVSVPDMFYWEIHGVVPSQDRSKIYAIGALSVTDADFTMYEVDAKTDANTRKIPLAPSVVGYCGLEYNLNDESSGVLWAENMQTGPADLAQLTGLPLQLKDPVDRLLTGLGLGGLVNSIENQLSIGVGGISEENLAAGTNTRFIATDYNANGSSASCGIAWNADGSRAFVSQMFEPLIDTINWNTKVVDGEIIPPTPYRGTTQHQSDSDKSRGLLFTANGTDGIAVYDMNMNTLVGRMDINSMIGHTVAVHGVEVSPSNRSILYVTGDGAPSGTYVVDVDNILAPQFLGGVEGGLDGSACGTYAIKDKMNYYRATGKCEQPKLDLAKTATFWESYADYTANKLSVKYNLSVLGQTVARNVMITDAQNTNGVTNDTTMPMTIGDVSSVAGATIVIKHIVPSGTTVFGSKVFASAQSPCGDTYEYPDMNTVGVPDAPPAA